MDDNEYPEDFRYYYISETGGSRGLVILVDMDMGFLAFFEEFRRRYSRNPVIYSKIGLGSSTFDSISSFLEPSQIFD